MPNISKEQRINIVKEIYNNPLFLGDLRGEETGILEFLDKLWPLRAMPSTDQRYSNARDDVWQHMVRNEDWDYDYLFLDRFRDTYENEETFVKFVELSVHPSLFSNEDDRRKMREDVDALLRNSKCCLVGKDYFDGKLVYSVGEITSSHIPMPESVQENTIPFYYGNDTVKVYPCFVLADVEWNDWYKWYTKFSLEYCECDNKSTIIGQLKIMKKDVEATNSVLPHMFKTLDDDWCSLGMEFSYYERIKQTVGANYQSVLYGLRDAAILPAVRDQFEEDACFVNSITREEEYHHNPKPLLDSVRYLLLGINVDDYYKFSYQYEPPFKKKGSAEKEIIDFDFKYNVPFEQRIIAIIGRNGSGKTTLLSKIADSFQLANDGNIIPNTPLYNKVITISFSIFDTFSVPKGNARFNYTYLGLPKEGKDKLDTLRSELRRHLDSINKKSRSDFWYRFLSEIMDKGTLEGLAKNTDWLAEIIVDNVMERLENLSSGENLLMYIFSSLLDEIKPHTLVMFDEPEMHLHPNAISKLIHYLYKLLKEYNSFCILATHSPQVIREIPADNVKIFRRNGDYLEVEPIAVETFSEDLSRISEYVFGDELNQRYYRQVITRLAKQFNDYDAVIRILQDGDRPVPVGTRMMVKSILLEQNAQSEAKQ